MESIIKRHRIALVLAGGYGGRMHMETPKQFLLLQGMPVIAHTLKAFENHPEIDVIAVVCLSGWEEYVERVKHDFHITKLQHIFSGGSNSHISIGNGIKGLSHYYTRDDIVLVHEAVRPLLSAKIISENIRICELYGNAITAVRDNEAVMYTEDGVSSYRCFPREQMYKAQTPHTFCFKRFGDSLPGSRTKIYLCTIFIYSDGRTEALSFIYSRRRAKKYQIDTP